MRRLMCSKAVLSSLSLLFVSALFCVAALTGGRQAHAQSPNGRHALTNEDVIKMVRAHLGTEIVVAQIRDNPGSYSLTTDKLIQLKELGVPDAVISAMQAKGNGSGPIAGAGQSRVAVGMESGREYTVTEFERLLPGILSKAAISHGLGPHSYDKEEKLIDRILDTCALDTSNLSVQRPDPKSPTFGICQRHPYQHTYVGTFEDLSLAAGDPHSSNGSAAVGRGDLLMDVGLPLDQPWWPGEKYTIALKIFMDWGPAGTQSRFAGVLSGVQIKGHIPQPGSWAVAPQAPSGPPADYSNQGAAECKAGRMIMDAGLMNTRETLRSDVPPPFPESAKADFRNAIATAPFGGTIKIGALVGTQGHVCALQIEAHAFPFPPANQGVAAVETALDKAAINAVSHWAFRPAPYVRRGVIEVTFRMEDGLSGPGSTSQAAAGNFPTIDASIYKNNIEDSPGIILTLDMIRKIPSILDDETPLLQDFIKLNYCHSSTIDRQLNSEFDYPAIAAFYKAHASQILAGMPLAVPPAQTHIDLGEYDASHSEFPVRASGNPRQGVYVDHVDIDSGGEVSSCVSILNFGGYLVIDRGGVLTRFGAVYRVAFAPVAFSELPMDVASAQRYVEGLPDPSARGARVEIGLQPLDAVPTITFIPPYRTVVTFPARVTEIKVISDRGSTAAAPGGVLLATLTPKDDMAPPAPGNSPPVSHANGNANWPPTSGQGVASPPQSLPLTAPVPHPGVMGSAFAKFLANCNAGNSGACDRAGFDLAHGWGVDRNPQMAKQFYEKSCTMGSREGCFDAKNASGN